MNMALVQISHTQGRVPVTVFQLQDRVNLGNFAELEATAKKAYENGTRDLVIDLSQTSILTSIGVRALVVIHKMLSEDRGKHLRLAGPTPEIRDMLEVSGVTQYIQIHDSVEEAVTSF
jgi:stage II sporulation protein AA (anti-sigma F factor antagonist)